MDTSYMLLTVGKMPFSVSCSLSFNILFESQYFIRSWNQLLKIITVRTKRSNSCSEMCLWGELCLAKSCVFLIQVSVLHRSRRFLISITINVLVMWSSWDLLTRNSPWFARMWSWDFPRNSVWFLYLPAVAVLRRIVLFCRRKMTLLFL